MRHSCCAAPLAVALDIHPSDLTCELAAGTLANGIEDLGLGIDILKLNPLATDAAGQSDANRQRIIDVGYFADSAACLASGSDTGNIATFAEPDGVDISNQQGCSTDTSTNEVTSSEEYSKRLEASVSVSGSGAAPSTSGSFTASVDFERVTSSILNEQSFFTSSTATCTTYKATFTFNAPHRFTNGAIAQIEALPTSFSEANKQQFFTFYNNFGTHVLFGMTMGSRHGQEIELRSTAREELAAQGLTVDFAAQASTKLGLFSGSAEVEANVGVFTAAQSALSSVSSSVKTYAYGPAPGAQGFSDAVRPRWSSPATLHALLLQDGLHQGMGHILDFHQCCLPRICSVMLVTSESCDVGVSCNGR